MFPCRIFITATSEGRGAPGIWSLPRYTVLNEPTPIGSSSMVSWSRRSNNKCLSSHSSMDFRNAMLGVSVLFSKTALVKGLVCRSSNQISMAVRSYV